MTTRTIIFAISEYYNIPLTIAKLRYENRINEGDYEDILTWYLEKHKED